MRKWFVPTLAAGSMVAAVLAAVVTAGPGTAAAAANAANAVSYAGNRGYRSSIAVLDTQTGAFSGAGDYNSAYASESVMKVFIATRLLLTGQMSGWNETTAYKMITQSDDASADALYGRTGGDSVITWVKQALNIPNLGSPPLQPGWWGGTQINARGMAMFYRAVRARPNVWGWLGNAMHHATQYGSDGTYQYFGIPSATTGAAIKQGWGGDDAAGLPEFNSTGLVSGDRYAVVILTQGGVYGAPISAMLTSEARLLMPGGRIVSDDPTGTVEHLTVYGNHLSVSGWSYDPDSPSSPVKMVLYVNGRLAAYGPTTINRPDVNAAFGISGVHGYSLAANLADGSNTVCVYATNIGPGMNATLGCHALVLSGSPIGTTALAVRGNVATVSGWAYDYDIPSDATKIVVYVNGRLAAYGMTTLTNPAVNSQYRISGTHGYAFTLPLPDGADTVCVYAINRGNGMNTALGCPTVALTGSPMGRVDSVTVANGQATVTGWTYDYDAPAQSIKAVLYRNGALAAYGPTAVMRSDVDSVFGISGTHGYTFTIPVPAGGAQLCMYGINVGPGANSTLGCRTVN